MTDHTVDVCVIDDDASERALLVRRLSDCQYTVVDAGSGAEGLRLIYAQRPKVVICDYRMPDLDGLQVCRRVRSDPTLDGVYFILLTGYQSADGKRLALNAGGDDYLEKPYDPDELRARIRSGLRFHRLQDRLQKAALTDGLTELWNHTQFRHLLDREFARTRRYGGVASLMMIDLDHFKSINDTFGHEVGNLVLRLAANHLAGAVRDIDIVARYGGEEFAVICPETGIDDAAALAERLRQGLANEVRLPQHPQITVRASIGVASSNDPQVESVTDLISRCDRALYYAKRHGRDQVVRCDHLCDSFALASPGSDELDRLRKEVYALSLRSKELCLQSIWALIQALDARDRYSVWHSRNVTQYVDWMVEAAGWPEPLRAAARNAAMLHDLGKIGLPDALLVKPRPLDPHDVARLREVPLVTCRILEPLRVFETEILMIRHLRESYDGTGYPDRLTGEEIPIGSRLIAICEAFDSMTCNRAYRPGRSLDEALGDIRAAAGTQFDPQFVGLMVQLARRERERWQAQIRRACVEPPAHAPVALVG